MYYYLLIIPKVDYNYGNTNNLKLSKINLENIILEYTNNRIIILSLYYIKEVINYV